MKNLLTLLFTIISIGLYAQSGSLKQSGYFARVTDTTTYQSAAATAHSQGYADWYWNAQATTPHVDWWNGSSYDHIFDFSGGGGGISELEVGVTDITGGTNTRVLYNNSGVLGEYSTVPATLLPDADDDGTTKGVATFNNNDFDAASGVVTLATGRTPAARYVIDQASASTAGGTITLDMNSQIQRSFVGSATFSAPKTYAMSNTTNSLFFNFTFQVTDVAAVITVPSDWLMSSGDFNGTTWTPPFTGKYEFGGSFDDTNNEWYVKVSGPFN